MKHTKIGDKIEVLVTTDYGVVTVEFLIIDVISAGNYIFLGYAQNRVARLQYKADSLWYFQGDIDVIDLIN